MDQTWYCKQSLCRGRHDREMSAAFGLDEFCASGREGGRGVTETKKKGELKKESNIRGKGRGVASMKEVELRRKS